MGGRKVREKNDDERRKRQEVTRKAERGRGVKEGRGCEAWPVMVPVQRGGRMRERKHKGGKIGGVFGLRTGL